jgi:FADH2-dependent halogenase
MTHYDADVAVIGGGPAGSTAAALLAAAGRRVIVFEKEVFPRFHIGESLLPFNTDIFRRLGVLEQLDDCFIQKWGARLLSSDGSVTRYIEFGNGFVPGYPMAYHVLRSRFDEILLRNAARRGATILEGHAVVGATHSHVDGCTVTARGPDGTTVERRARFLLDASGRDAFVASRRKLRKMMPSLRKASLFAQYEGVPRAEGRAAGDIFLIVMRDGWFWMIPLPGDRTSIGLVTDGAILKSSGLSHEELLDRALRRCPAAWEMVRDARRVTEVWSASDYSYWCRDIAGDGVLLLGDAAAFIDPIFSTGVLLAMSSGEMAADAVDAALRRGGRPADLAPSAFAGYARKVRQHVGIYKGIVERFYRPGFMDVFLQPSGKYRITNSVITLLAGLSEPPPAVRARLLYFYLVLRLQRHLGLVTPVPLLGVLEEAKA